MSAELHDLVVAALYSAGLLPPNEFLLARYSLNASTRNRLLDPDIGALEDALIDRCGLPESDLTAPLLESFAQSVVRVLADDAIALNVSYVRLGWLLAWLNTRHPPAFFGADPDSPLQMLQMAAAVGFGEWAAAHNHIEEGFRQLMDTAQSPVARIQQSAALGVSRLLLRQWQPTVRRIRTHAIMATPLEWRAIITALTLRDLAQDRHQWLEALDLLQTALHFIRNLPPERRKLEDVMALETTLCACLPQLVAMWSEVGFAQLGVWAYWPDAGIKKIITVSLETLLGWPAEAEAIKRILG